MTVVAGILTALAWVLGLVAAGLLVLLVVPAHIEARGYIEGADAAGRAQARWGWWVFVLRVDSATGLTIRVFGIRVWRWRPGAGRDDGDDDATTSWWRERGRRAGGGLQALRHRRGLWRLLRRIVGAFPVTGHLVGTIGLRDPADTAALFVVVDRLDPEARFIHVDPDWIDDTFELDGALRLRIWPAHVLAAALYAVIADGEVRRAVWALARPRRVLADG